MHRSNFTGWALAAALVVAALSACAQEEGPILLPNPKPAVKPASPTLLVTCDLVCNWKLDGKPRGHIAAGDSAITPLSLGQHLVAAATTDGLDKVEKELDIEAAKQTLVRIELAPVRDARFKAGQEAKDKAAREKASEPWTDPATGLMWARKDNGSDITWQGATDYCRNLQLAGHGDWRLPTIDELQGIFDAKFNVGGYFVKGNLQLTGSWEWSTSQGDASGEKRLFYFGLGERRSFPPGYLYFSRALCVRSSAQDSTASVRTQQEDAA